MKQIQDELVKSLNEINLKILQDVDLTKEDKEILLLSNLWGEESNERG